MRFTKPPIAVRHYKYRTELLWNISNSWTFRTVGRSAIIEHPKQMVLEYISASGVPENDGTFSC